MNLQALLHIQQKIYFCVFFTLRPSRMRSMSAPPTLHVLTCEGNGDQQGRLSPSLSLLQLKSTKMEFYFEEEEGHEEDEELLSVLGASFRAELVEISLKWRIL